MGDAKSIARKADARFGGLTVLLGLGLLTLVFFWKILLTNLILTGVDVFTYFYPYRDYAAQAVRQARLPLWNPYLFLGVPFLANSQAAVFYPLHWPLAWLPVPKQIAFSIALHVFLSGIFAYLYARRSLEVSRFSAFIGGIIFAFGGFVGAQVEHVNQLNAATWLPLLLLFWDGRHSRRNLLWAGLTVGLMLLAGHTQTAYICLFGWGVYAIVGRGSKKRPWRQGVRRLTARLILYALVIGIGLGIAAVQLVPTLELSQLSNRAEGMSYLDASSFSLRPQLLPYTLLPTFGENLAQVFGGEAFSEYIAYVGVLGLFLALVGALFRGDSRQRGPLVVLAGLGLFLAAGRVNPVYYLLYKVMPGFALFRAPARWMLLYAFAGAMLAALGADFLFAPTDVKARMTNRPQAQLARWAWRRLLNGGGLVALPFVLLAPWFDFPAWPTLTAWATLGLAALVVWAGSLTAHTARRGGKMALTGLLLAELFAASRGLAYNRATAPEALSSLRTAPAHLLADARFGGQMPPSRFLSLSDIRYDPGDLADIEALLADQLPPEAIYDFVVATKRKEILAPNLPLYYRLPAVDGYDGGLLPLQRYVTLQRLFLDEDKISPDGRLREQLQQVPAGRLLALLNVKYVITDKVYDVWIDDVFYDLQHRAVLGVGATEVVDLTDLPGFETTTLGIASYLEGSEEVKDGEAIAEVTIVAETGRVERHLLRAGIDTAEGEYAARQPQHALARVGHHWRDNAEGNDYVTRLPLNQTATPRRIVVRYLAPTGRLHLRGLTLIDERMGAFYPLTVSTSGRFRLVHSGDVKVYENLESLPRAYVVHQVQITDDDETALAMLQDPAFDPMTSAVLAAQDSPPELTSGSQTNSDDEVSITRYEPEHIVLEANLARDGYLVLSDTHYPGWRVRVDGVAGTIYRANLLFRAVPLPAGRHTVEFVFQPPSLYVGAGVSGGAVILVILGLGVLTRREPHHRPGIAR
jgi:hypothetical protein